jgi:hypothetical protein
MIMTIHHIYIKTGLAFAICLTLSACKKFVEVPEPIDQISTEVVFQSDSKAASAVRGLYGEMVGSTGFFTSVLGFSGAVQISAGVSADELTLSSSGNQFNEFYTNAISSSNGVNEGSIWGPTYNVIYNTNAVIESLDKSPGVSATGKKQLTAEAKFVRAANYFYLVNLYGDIPMPTTTDYRLNATLPNIPADQIYALILEDLKYAKDNLSPAYIGTQRLRANKYAAAALLARVYLYKKDWINAETLATEVIDGAGKTMYDLEPDLNKTFLTSSKEVILQLQQPGTNLYTWDGYNFISSGIPQYPISDALYNSFEANDQRKTSWIKTNTVTTAGVSKNYNFPFKYKLNSGTGTTRTESMVFLRLSEIYLIRSEARAQQSKLTEAIADLDVIRKRAINTVPFPSTGPGTGKDGLLDLIAHERFVELFTEGGHRWLDLKRTGKADEVLSKKPNWRPQAKLYPVPKGDIDKNPFLKQNPGYN